MRRVPTRAIDAQPIGDLNMTPLIDVLLVLLVMFIISVPAMMHEVPVDLPQPGREAGVKPVTYVVGLSRAGQASLDGVAMSDGGVAARLRVLKDDPATAVLFRADGQARYDRAAHLLAAVKRAGVTRLAFDGVAGFVG